MLNQIDRIEQFKEWFNKTPEEIKIIFNEILSYISDFNRFDIHIFSSNVSKEYSRSNYPSYINFMVRDGDYSYKCFRVNSYHIEFEYRIGAKDIHIEKIIDFGNSVEYSNYLVNKNREDIINNILN